MTSLVPARDIPLQVISPAASSERRVNPSWTISQLKAKLEPITGIAPSLQTLTLRLPNQLDGVVISTEDEDLTEIGSWSLTPYAELHDLVLRRHHRLSSPKSHAYGTTGAQTAEGDDVVDYTVKDAQPASTHPSAGTAIPAPSSVPKYEMPVETYSTLPDTVLAYKKTHHIGRFDPNAPELKAKKVDDLWKEIAEGGIVVGARCILPPSTTRRGTVAYVGLIPGIPGVGPRVGVKLDEPAGKNDGSVGGQRYFECDPHHGIFVRPDRVEVGDWRELGLDEDDDDPDEI
ncbi:MAG: hypothetical protein Q9207_001906 [Kuettlingeria erythrocarpa]